mmetsp:Transcript_27219/g.60264  ORF Transcript_27219/g.60264 Transcript_27219/m.60264 type:complete len:626 (+) Transcript_27219:604-2481(+)
MADNSVSAPVSLPPLSTIWPPLSPSGWVGPAVTISRTTASPASLTNAAMSAPLNPFARSSVATSFSTTPSGVTSECQQIATFFVNARKMLTLSWAVGSGTCSSLPSLPGRSMASSMSSSRLVAAIMYTSRLDSRPSSSVSSWLTTRSLTPLPLPPEPSPDPRLGQRASSSSKKITHGAEERALANTCLTLDSDSPTYILSSSGPLTEMKFAPDWLASALASSVLPQPGGPKNSTPAGTSKPRCRKRSGWAMGSSTLCSSSSRTSASAPTSAQVTLGATAKPSLLAVGWMDLAARVKSPISTKCLSGTGVTTSIAPPSSTLVASLPTFVSTAPAATSNAPAVTAPATAPAAIGIVGASTGLAATMRVTASMPASLASACRSEPTNPGVALPRTAKSTDWQRRICFVIRRRMCARAGASGTGSATSLEKRPRTPGSRASALFVAAISTTPLNPGCSVSFDSSAGLCTGVTPSVSAGFVSFDGAGVPFMFDSRPAFSFIISFSLSAAVFLPPRAEMKSMLSNSCATSRRSMPLCEDSFFPAITSRPSMKRTEGALAAALSNICRTRSSDSPDVPPTSSGPDALKKGKPSSPAIAVASRVFPHPEGPCSRIPQGGLTPSREYSSGYCTG